jgi:hypothetical protein
MSHMVVSGSDSQHGHREAVPGSVLGSRALKRCALREDNEWQKHDRERRQTIDFDSSAAPLRQRPLEVCFAGNQ